MTIKRILVPVDFSEPSLAALEYAVSFAKPFKARLTMLFVVEPVYSAVPGFADGATVAMADLLDQQRRSARAQLVRLEQRYAKRRVKLRALLQTGSAHRAIADAAKQTKTDMIIMATHGRTGLSHLLMGSVAERVVRSATCPVLTLRAGSRVRRSAPRRRTALRARARAARR
jgi:nucleotide-binding universal stress UspA family protein